MKRLLLVLAMGSAGAFAGDFFSIGVKAGVPLNDAFNAASNGNINYITNTKRYTLGPTVEIGLPFGLAVEADALYRRLGYDAEAGSGDTFVRRAVTANAWDFPLLLKFRAGSGPIRPFVDVGPTFRNVSSFKQVTNFFTGGSNSSSGDHPVELNNRFTTGFTVGGGIAFGGKVRLSPEVRYTRWGWDTFKSTGGLFHSNPDQVDFLLGLTF